MHRFLAVLAVSAILTASPADTKAVTPAERVAKEVRHELIMLPYYGVFDNLAFKVDGTNVTLMGQVTNPTLKSDAYNVVKGIEGIGTVTNDIEVLPLSPNDNLIRRAVHRAIYNSPGLDKYGWGAIPSIHIIVKNGNVTLLGFVNNQGDKNMAGIQANTVPGVFSVTNDLVVQTN